MGLENRAICATKVWRCWSTSPSSSKNLLVEGPAGVGKTELAKAFWWNYRKQLLSIQAGFGSKEDWQTLEHDLFTETFLISRPLLQGYHRAPAVCPAGRKT